VTWFDQLCLSFYFWVARLFQRRSRKKTRTTRTTNAGTATDGAKSIDRLTSTAGRFALSDDGKIDQGILEAVVMMVESGQIGVIPNDGAELLMAMANELIELRQKSEEDDTMLRQRVRERADAAAKEEEFESRATFTRKYIGELQAQIEKLITLDEKFVVKELHSLVKQIAGGGVTGGDFIGLRFSIYQIHELMVRLGLKPEKPNERYIPYVDLLTKYGSTSAALEAALKDLKNPDNANAKTIFNMRRLLGIGPDEDPLAELEKLLGEMTSGVAQVEHIPAPKGYTGPTTDIPDPDKVH
jgi:hypothetical protein